MTDADARAVEPDEVDFAVCFAGARDNYEAAVALAEVGRLEMLMTDLYLGSVLTRRFARRWVKASAPRYNGALSESRVRSVLEALVAQKSQRAAVLLGGTGQQILARRFAAMTHRSKAHLLCYAGYGRPAFEAAGCGRRKVLFQYHPHRTLETEVLHAAGISIAPHADPDDTNNTAEINTADAIVCASSFTKRSVERILMRPTPIIVAPYGSNIAMAPKEVLESRPPAGKGLRMLFVGSGTLRKGLDLLLSAWDRVGAREDRLTLIVRGVDPALAPILERPRDNVAVRSNLSRDALVKEFLSADVFVFPSFCEGFAHVVPEALSLGLYTIASDATCLADINVPPGTGRVVPAGDIGALVAAINEARRIHSTCGFDVVAICAVAGAFSWAGFREKIRLACGV